MGTDLGALRQNIRGMEKAIKRAGPKKARKYARRLERLRQIERALIHRMAAGKIELRIYNLSALETAAPVSFSVQEKCRHGFGSRIAAVFSKVSRIFRRKG
jgi:hypothetical protein